MIRIGLYGDGGLLDEIVFTMKKAARAAIGRLYFIIILVDPNSPRRAAPEFSC